MYHRFANGNPGINLGLDAPDRGDGVGLQAASSISLPVPVPPIITPTSGE